MANSVSDVVVVGISYLDSRTLRRRRNPILTVKGWSSRATNFQRASGHLLPYSSEFAAKFVVSVSHHCSSLWTRFCFAVVVIVVLDVLSNCLKVPASVPPLDSVAGLKLRSALLLWASSTLKYIQSAAIALTCAPVAPDCSLIAQFIGERHAAVKWCGAVISEPFFQYDYEFIHSVSLSVRPFYLLPISRTVI